MLTTESAKVLYPYDAILSDELSLTTNDHITNIQWPKRGNTWAQGVCRGKTGLFHPLCVQQYDPMFENLQRLKGLSRGRGDPSGHSCTYKGKGYIFKKKPEDWYICGICMELAVVPIQTSCCGQTYCNSCILTWTKRKKTCPQCRSEEFSSATDVRTERFILNLEMYCPNHAQGCDWQGVLRELDGHIAESCPYATIPCPNACGRSLQRYLQKVHVESECPMRKITCPFCARILKTPPRITYKKMTTSHYTDCPYWPVRCPNHCENGQILQRNTVEGHMLEDCPKQMITCHYRDFGCKFETLRENMEDHLKSDVHKHLNLVAVSYRGLKMELDELKRQGSKSTTHPKK